MADNTCHFGINSFFADNSLSDLQSWLYFPADAAQMNAIINRVFFERGLRFVFSTRAKVPYILKPNGENFFGADYVFTPGKDDIIQTGSAGYVVSYGEMLYRSWDAVQRCRQAGIDVGLINKATLNLVDEETIKLIGSTKFVLVVESLNQKTGLGSKFGTWLLERQLTPKYGYMGTIKEGCGGLQEQIPHQGLDPQCTLLSCLFSRAFTEFSDELSSYFSDHGQDQPALSLTAFLFVSSEVNVLLSNRNWLKLIDM